MLLGDKKDEKN